jgi:hypothetical protein
MARKSIWENSQRLRAGVKRCSNTRTRISGVTGIAVLLIGETSRQRESKNRAIAGFRLDPNPPVMLFHDFFADGQADTISGMRVDHRHNLGLA